MIRRSGVAIGTLLGVFHVWLFGQQAWSGQLSDPATVARWLLALALLAGLVGLRRRRLPVLFGRQAVAMWVLAALLHGPALVNDHDGFATPVVPEVVVTVAQTAATLAALGLSLLALWWLALTTASTARSFTALDEPRVHRVAGLGASTGFLPRPPPLT
jgi:MYXO-CTERM domain-containing protein